MGDGGDDRAKGARPIGPAVVTTGSRIARVLWALPASLVGLLLAPFFSRRSFRSGVLLCEDARWPRRLGWRYRAITFGHVVLSVDRLDDHTFRHELVHVRQYERWGIALFPAYLAAGALARLRGGSAYRDNPFEVQARAETVTAGGSGEKGS